MPWWVAFPTHQRQDFRIPAWWVKNTERHAVTYWNSVRWTALWRVLCKIILHSFLFIYCCRPACPCSRYIFYFRGFFYCLANAGQPIFYPRVSFLYYDFCDTPLIFDILSDFEHRRSRFSCHRKTQKMRQRKIKYNKVKGVNCPLNMWTGVKIRLNLKLFPGNIWIVARNPVLLHPLLRS